MTRLRTAATAVARRRLAITIYGLLAVSAGSCLYAFYWLGEVATAGGGFVAVVIGVAIAAALVAWDLSRE